MYSLKFHKSVKKFIESKDKKTKLRFKKVFLELSKNPFPTNPKIDSRQFKDNIPNKYRLRIGKYRFLYIINRTELIVIIENADSRGDIY